MAKHRVPGTSRELEDCIWMETGKPILAQATQFAQAGLAGTTGLVGSGMNPHGCIWTQDFRIQKSLYYIDLKSGMFKSLDS